MLLDATLINLIRLRDDRITCTGGVVFIGDGNTGKTHTAMNLTNTKGKWFYHQDENNLKKSVNLELDYFIFQSHIEEYKLTTSSQIFIMPGQKGYAKAGEGLAFEDACDLFLSAASINTVLVLVLTYDLTDVNTFQDLEYWLNRAIERDFVRNYTTLILLGTHLDFVERPLIKRKDIENAKEFIKTHIYEKQGILIDNNNIHSLSVSNITGEGIPEFMDLINIAFLRAFNIEKLLERMQ